MGRRGDRWPRQPETLLLPLQAAQKQPSTRVGVVVGMADVAAVGCHPTRQLAHQPRPVRADQLQDDGRRRHKPNA